HHGQQNEGRRYLGDDDFSRVGGRHEQLLDRPCLSLFDHRPGGDERAVEYQQEAEDAGHDEPRIDQTWVVKKGGLQQRSAAPADLRRGDPPYVSADALRQKSAVVVLDNAFDVALADSGRVRVRRVQKNLNGGCAASIEVAGEVVRDDQTSVEVVAFDCVAEIAG